MNHVGKLLIAASLFALTACDSNDNDPPPVDPPVPSTTVQVLHASPDAPAVDIAVTGGPVLFSNVSFKGTGDYLPVDAGAYDLEARIAGTDTVALSVPGVTLEEGNVYTIFAMGLAGGEPALTAVPSVDASYDMAMPETLPTTGGETINLWLLAAFGAGLALIAGGLIVRFRTQESETR
jgi:LPXTG-motif cell wall-anchored protein